MIGTLSMGSQSQCGRNLGRDRAWLLRDERVAVEWRQVQRARNEAPSEVVVLLAVRQSREKRVLACNGAPDLSEDASNAPATWPALHSAPRSARPPWWTVNTGLLWRARVPPIYPTALHSKVLRAARALHACVCEQCMRAVGIT